MITATTVMPTQDVTIGDTFVRISGQGLPLVFVHGLRPPASSGRSRPKSSPKRTASSGPTCPAMALLCPKSKCLLS
jgi:hypothetical protein